MNEALKKYRDILGPWAELTTSKILGGISRYNLSAWSNASKTIGKELKTLRATTTIGSVAQNIQTSQVELIKSIPIEAGIRAQYWAQEASTSGYRASQVAEQIQRTSEVTENRAVLIARTEVAKANAAINQARAQYIGVTQYIWRTAQDGDVRESHAELEGNVFSYDDPPFIEGEGAHGPGEFPNCRCFSEPIISNTTS